MRVTFDYRPSSVEWITFEFDKGMLIGIESDEYYNKSGVFSFNLYEMSEKFQREFLEAMEKSK